jgi:division/cell wall cluster transcriptional repressor MraZ
MATPAQGSNVPTYIGEHPRVVDASHRLLLPIEWRPKGAPTHFYVLRWPIASPECLLVLPPDRWAMFLKKFEELALSPDDSAEAERQLGANMFACTLDQFGRLPLPEPAASGVGITNAAILIGRLQKFEIWNPERRQKTLDQPDTSISLKLSNRYGHETSTTLVHEWRIEIAPQPEQPNLASRDLEYARLQAGWEWCFRTLAIQPPRAASDYAAPLCVLLAVHPSSAALENGATLAGHFPAGEKRELAAHGTAFSNRDRPQPESTAQIPR